MNGLDEMITLADLSLLAQRLGKKGIDALLGRTPPPPPALTWERVNGAVRVSFRLDCQTQVIDWPDYFSKKGIYVSEEASALIRTLGMISGQEVSIDIIPGKNIADDKLRTTHALIDEGFHGGCGSASLEIGCLLRTLLTDETIRAMGFRMLAVFHEPIRLSAEEEPKVLMLAKVVTEEALLTCDVSPTSLWAADCGIVFVKP